MKNKNYFWNLLDYCGGKVLLLVGCAFIGLNCGFAGEAFAYTASIATSGTVSMEVSASGNQANIGVDNVVVNSTCPLGYVVSIVGPSDSALYKNGNNADGNKIDPSAGTSDAPRPILGSDGGNSYLGTWGYTTQENATVSSNFIGLTGTPAVLVTKNSASTSGGDTISVHYGVSVTSTTEPGIYTLAESSPGANDNVITYYLTTSPNCNSFIIKYNDNGANSPTTMAGVSHVVAENDEVTLMPSNYQRSNYGFAGWSTEQLNPDATDFDTKLATARANGHVFGPMETITVDQSLISQSVVDNNTQVITLYAIWVKPKTNPTTSQPETLQDWTGCSTLSQGQVTALKDIRDNNTYAIAKLPDGDCWMIENLRLDNTATINSTNTDNPASEFAFVAPQNPTATNPWCNESTEACVNQPLLATFNTADTVAEMTSINQNIYSYGNLYNWYSATAGRGTLSTDGGQNVSGSICPAGWRLPTGGGSGDTNSDFWRLSVATVGFEPQDNTWAEASRYRYGNLDNNNHGVQASLAMRSYPANFIYSHALHWSPGVVNTGYLWTSTAYNTNNGFLFVVNNSYEYPGSGSNTKNSGFGVRCVVDDFVQYDENGANSPTTMGNQVIEPSDSEIVLWASNFKRPGYGFAGWNTKADGTGTSYGPNETITDTTTVNNIKDDGLKLYAMWVPSAGNLQAWDGCSALSIGAVTALTDTRDNNTYAIAKLADGQCWMIENLRLDSTATINSTNTNNPVSGFTLATAHNPTEANPWCTDLTEACVNQSQLVNANTVDTVEKMTDRSQNVYGYGNYYNWYAATAGNGTYGTIDVSSNVAGSICPAGWRLPTGGSDVSNTDFGRLAIQSIGSAPNELYGADAQSNRLSRYGNLDGGTLGTEASNKLRTYPYNYVYSGLVDSSAISYHGISYVSYWSSTPNGRNGVLSTVMVSSRLYPGTANTTYILKRYGLSVRCVK